MADVTDPRDDAAQLLVQALSETDGEHQPRALALIALGQAALAVVDELRVHSLIAYLQALLQDPAPSDETVGQIRRIAASLELRLGLVEARS